MASETSPDATETVIPLLSEDISIEHRHIENKVTVKIETTSREHLVDERLSRQQVEIERVAIGRIVDTVPQVREDGDTTVIPVFEEILVTERRLLLKEEIHLRRINSTERHHALVTLREQHATIERTGPDGQRDGGTATGPALAPIPKPQAEQDEIT